MTTKSSSYLFMTCCCCCCPNYCSFGHSALPEVNCGCFRGPHLQLSLLWSPGTTSFLSGSAKAGALHVNSVRMQGSKTGASCCELALGGSKRKQASCHGFKGVLSLLATRILWLRLQQAFFSLMPFPLVCLCFMWHPGSSRSKRSATCGIERMFFAVNEGSVLTPSPLLLVPLLNFCWFRKNPARREAAKPVQELLAPVQDALQRQCSCLQIYPSLVFSSGSLHSSEETTDAGMLMQELRHL